MPVVPPLFSCSRYEVDSFEELAGAEARKVILFLAVMAAHAVGEGSGVGVSFAGNRGWCQGTLVTLAIGLHNVPEGLAVATVMAARGASPRKTLLWTTLTALPQVRGAGDGVKPSRHAEVR
jgi:zinc transporter ZupT